MQLDCHLKEPYLGSVTGLENNSYYLFIYFYLLFWKLLLAKVVNLLQCVVLVGLETETFWRCSGNAMEMG